MKKIYFAPNTTITKVELQRMIAASDPTDQTLDPNEDNPIENGDEIGSRRRGSVWEDEEEEEEDF